MPKLLRWRSAWLTVLLLLGACGADSGSIQPGIGTPLPTVMLTGLTDPTPTSTEALHSTALVITFWATWCDPCRREMPSFERLSHRLAAHGVRVIGVAVDHDLNLAREFVRTHKLTFPIYVDGDRKALQSGLRVVALPETVLVSAEGRIVARILGERDWDGAEGARVLEHAFNLRLAPGR
ncbi:MAG: TlpA family protein disulfide reductase [Betaproteobacteria bacterium]|nr:TlpA family protein disulfide reductase [Betaproteobacteria bacterium]